MKPLQEVIKGCYPVTKKSYLKFCKELQGRDQLFHPEDSAFDQIKVVSGEPTFTAEEALIVEAYMEEVFRVLPDPCAIALSVLNIEGGTE